MVTRMMFFFAFAWLSVCPISAQLFYIEEREQSVTGSPFSFLNIFKENNENFINHESIELFFSDDDNSMLSPRVRPSFFGPGFLRGTPCLRGQQCSEELGVFCADESISDGRGALAESFVKQMCLMRHREHLSAQCLDFFDEIEDNLVTACYADIDAYCIDTPPGNHRVHSCLRAHAEQISPKCSNQIGFSAPLVDESLASSSFDIDITLDFDSIFQTLNNILFGAEAMDDAGVAVAADPSALSLNAPATAKSSVFDILFGSEPMDDADVEDAADPPALSGPSFSMETATAASTPKGKDTSRKNRFNVVLIAGIVALGAASLLVLAGIASRAVKRQRDRNAEEEWTRTFAPSLLA